MLTIQKDTQVNFRTNSDLLERAKAVLKTNNLDMTTSFNLFLENIVVQNALPILTEEELRREQLFKNLKDEVNQGIADIEAGRTLSEAEMRARFGL